MPVQNAGLGSAPVNLTGAASQSEESSPVLLSRGVSSRLQTRTRATRSTSSHAVSDRLERPQGRRGYKESQMRDFVAHFTKQIGKKDPVDLMLTS